MSAVVIIPARYSSTRFPGKPLALLNDKPLIQHVYENSKGSRLASDVIVATDSKRILKKVLSFGGKAVMTSKSHVSGTDRIAEVASGTNYDIIVNVQGDEPLIRPQMIDAVIELLADKRASIGTLAKKIESPKEILDPNVVKVTFDAEGFALYFSRAPIPYHRQEWKNLKTLTGSHFTVYKHIGIYSYRKDVLMKLSRLKPSALEQIEKLEQLRALENGMRIKVGETEFQTIGVDTPEDIERVKRCLNLSL
jgi:3-deoxy-manno-octulosonate cytidylyltransferase (CMP-KDO synthetase)